MNDFDEDCKIFQLDIEYKRTKYISRFVKALIGEIKEIDKSHTGEDEENALVIQTCASSARPTLCPIPKNNIKAATLTNSGGCVAFTLGNDDIVHLWASYGNIDYPLFISSNGDNICIDLSANEKSWVAGDTVTIKITVKSVWNDEIKSKIFVKVIFTA